MVVRDEVRKMKSVAPLVAALDNKTRCKALIKVAECLVKRRAEIFAANKKDLEAAEQNGDRQAASETPVKKIHGGYTQAGCRRPCH